jgi:hypothetical protein
VYQQLIDKNNRTTVEGTLHGCEFFTFRGDVYIIRERSKLEGRVNLIPGKEKYWDGRFCIKVNEPHLHIQELGEQGWSAVKKILDRALAIPAKAAYVTPAVFNAENKLVYSVFLEEANNKVASVMWYPVN